MGHRDPRIDAYIAKSAGFAQPILHHLREAVHAACPMVEETLKWGAPSFGYRGRILCRMAAFKRHASFGFWQGAQVVGAASHDTHAPHEGTLDQGMGQFGRLGQLSDLPESHALAGYIAQAMALVDAGMARPSSKAATPRPPLPVPDDLASALKRNAEAQAAFDGFPPSHRREYVDWITDAKRDETRQRRLAQAIEWLAQGKPRNWKYMNC